MIILVVLPGFTGPAENGEGLNEKKKKFLRTSKQINKQKNEKGTGVL